MGHEETVAARRALLNAPPAATHGEPVDASRGRRIVARSYVKQCHLQQRVPDWEHFDRLAGITGPSTAERDAFRAEIYGEVQESGGGLPNRDGTVVNTDHHD
jgi:hypothetical protein